MHLKDAVCDLRFLLNRGYPRKRAITFVSDKYGLSSGRRNFLMRSVFSAVGAEQHRKKLIPLDDVRGEEILVDGYNVLITVESALRGRELILCDDGFVRDTAAVFGKHRITRATHAALDRITESLLSLRPKSVTFVFDAQVSHSGELCSMLRERKAAWEAFTSGKTDRYLKKSREIISTSDSAIIEKAERVVDLPRNIARDTCEIKKLPTCEDMYLMKGS